LAHGDRDADGAVVAGAGAINGKLYAVGGNGGITLQTTEVYTP
jgi:hypothetical protein